MTASSLADLMSEMTAFRGLEPFFAFPSPLHQCISSCHLLYVALTLPLLLGQITPHLTLACSSSFSPDDGLKRLIDMQIGDGPH